MKIKLTLLLILFIALSTTQYAIAGSTQKQRIILIKGDESFLMKGDPFIKSFNKPHNFRKNAALHFFLKNGWSIQSLHINEKSTEDQLYGYIVIRNTH